MNITVEYLRWTSIILQARHSTATAPDTTTAVMPLGAKSRAPLCAAKLSHLLLDGAGKELSAQIDKRPPGRRTAAETGGASPLRRGHEPPCRATSRCRARAARTTRRQGSNTAQRFVTRGCCKAWGIRILMQEFPNFYWFAPKLAEECQSITAMKGPGNQGMTTDGTKEVQRKSITAGLQKIEWYGQETDFR